MDILEPEVTHDFLRGLLAGKGVVKSQKYYGDAKAFYAQEDKTLKADTLLYEVYTYAKGDCKVAGNLNWGMTVLKPVRIEGECNMTRGHFHEDMKCAEFYFGLAGEGLLLFMREDGSCFAEKVFPNSLHYIDGHIAHRLLNTGEDDFKVGACWPTVAGHDYQRIEAQPFPVRVFKRDGNIIVEEEK